jgi:cytidyltransferase-like protein
VNVVFSGRYDPPHCGHIRSIQELGQQYDHVFIVVLDHEEQKYPPQYRAQILRELLECAKGSYTVSVNKDHFANIDAAKLVQYEPFVYASGNLECLFHVERLGYETLYVNRAYSYEASEDRRLRKIKEALD